MLDKAYHFFKCRYNNDPVALYSFPYSIGCICAIGVVLQSLPFGVKFIKIVLEIGNSFFFGQRLRKVNGCRCFSPSSSPYLDGFVLHGLRDSVPVFKPGKFGNGLFLLGCEILNTSKIYQQRVLHTRPAAWSFGGSSAIILKGGWVEAYRFEQSHGGLLLNPTQFGREELINHRIISDDNFVQKSLNLLLNLGV